MEFFNQQEQSSIQNQPQVQQGASLQASPKMPYLWIGLCGLAISCVAIFFIPHPLNYKALPAPAPILNIGECIINIATIFTLWGLARIFKVRDKLFSRSVFIIGFGFFTLTMIRLLSLWLPVFSSFLISLPLVLLIYFLLVKYTFKLNWLKSIGLSLLQIIIITPLIAAILTLALTFSGLSSSLNSLISHISNNQTIISPNKAQNTNTSGWQCLKTQVVPSAEYISPNSIATDSKGNIFYTDNYPKVKNSQGSYVSDFNRHGISKIDPQGNLTELWFKSDSFINTVLVDSNDNVYGVGFCEKPGKKNCLYVLDKDGRDLKYNIEVNDVFSNNFGVFIGQNDNIYIVDNHFANIEKYGKDYNDVIEINNQGKLVRTYEKVGQGVERLFFSSNGIIYTFNTGDTNNGYASISKISNGQITMESIKLDREAEAITMDSDGNIYMAYGHSDSPDFPQYKIIKITLEGMVSEKDLGNIHPGHVEDIFVDSSGVYVHIKTGGDSAKIFSNPIWDYVLKYDFSLDKQGIVWSTSGDRFTEPFYLTGKNQQYIIFSGQKNTGYHDDVKYYLEKCQ